MLVRTLPRARRPPLGLFSSIFPQSLIAFAVPPAGLPSRFTSLFPTVDLQRLAHRLYLPSIDMPLGIPRRTLSSSLAATAAVIVSEHGDLLSCARPVQHQSGVLSGTSVSGTVVDRSIASRAEALRTNPATLFFDLSSRAEHSSQCHGRDRTFV